jgi:ABC-type transport system involved in cytochrome c biogenesis permease subunit
MKVTFGERGVGLLASVAAAVWLVGGAAAAAVPEEVAHLLDPEVIEAVAVMPVQNGGRVKPFDAQARLTLRALRGGAGAGIETDFGVEGGEEVKIGATGWLLLTVFEPELVKGMDVFVVDNTEALVEIGARGELVKRERDRLMSELGMSFADAERRAEGSFKKRGRFSYRDIEVGRERLEELSAQIRERMEREGLKTDQLEAVQKSVLELASRVQAFEMLGAHFDYLREPLDVGETVLADPRLELFHGEGVTLGDIAPELAGFMLAAPSKGLMPPSEEFVVLLRQVQALAARATAVVALAPAKAEEEEWGGPGQMMFAALGGRELDPVELARLEAWGDIFRAHAAGDAAGFKEKVLAFAADMKGVALERGEGQQLAREVSYLRADYFTVSAFVFVFSFLLVAVGWARPGAGVGKWLGRLSLILAWLALGIATWGIVQRCLIMSRPPIGTLYETILFNTAGSVLVALFMEMAFRNRIALSVAAFLGFTGMFLSWGFLESEGGRDTMDPLVAVLRTNFWLGTHVTTINFGYVGGLVAAAVSMVYILLRSLRLIRARDEVSKSLTTMLYGSIAFCLIFSIVGTILGGIWANYSWGRFWGWDPKENGALMIVLWTLLIFHARLGGYLRELGLHVGSVLLGMIVLFSWFGVNRLEIGLHSYGFIDGVGQFLLIARLIGLAFLLAAAWLWVTEGQDGKKLPKPAPKIEPGAAGSDELEVRA